MLRKRTVGRLDQLAVLAAEARLAVMGWRRARDNRNGSKPGTPIGPQPDVALRKTSAGPTGPRSSRWCDRTHQVHSYTAAPADSADALCT